MDRLFDIARRNALNLIKNDKDKQFLILQREVGRPGSAFARAKKGKIEEEPTTEPEPSLESQSATSVFTIDGGDEKPSTSRAFSERSKSKIMTPILAATLDRIGLSDRNALYAISAVLTSAGLNLEDYTVSRQTISRARAEYRQEIAQNIQSNFDLNGPLVVHWDEKLLHDLTGTDKVERLPVLVSSGANVQLLGVPKLSSGTGERQANEVCKLMNAWELSDRICAMGFDTTGIKIGACTLIEKRIGRDLLWLACRHHIAEVLMTAA
ncbi:uncharacterized protein LOC134221932 [Armigeres subalbatus]|uniref:uncharacterized protein LOC134221932 n=1 Tax=Armigeres subalbatus TaxID=124917 RepID=UPI002ED15BC9